MARILVVDDDATLLSLLTTLLRHQGHSVDDAGNGAEALAVMQTAPYDLLITDMNMPVMTGLELISECRGLYPNLRSIAISGGDSTGNIDSLTTAGILGAEETLYKPFTVDDLLGAVERCLAPR
jgi:CheY-like chemotaxis protein